MTKKEFIQRYSAKKMKLAGIQDLKRAAALKKMFLFRFENTPASLVGNYREINGRRCYCNRSAAFNLDPVNYGYDAAPDSSSGLYANVARVFDDARSDAGRYIDITRDDVKRGTVYDNGNPMFFVDFSEDNMLLYARVNPDYLLNVFDVMSRDLLRVHISGAVNPLYIVNSAGEEALLMPVISTFESYNYYKSLLARAAA